MRRQPGLWQGLGVLAAVACAPKPPAQPEPIRTADDLYRRTTASNEGWHSLRARATVAVEMMDARHEVERRAFELEILAQRPSRLRLRARSFERPYFDVLSTGTRPQLISPLPETERAGRLRELLGSLIDDVRVAFRMRAQAPERIEMAQLRHGSRRDPLLELREYDRSVLLARSTYDPSTLDRLLLEQGRNGEVQRTIHYAAQQPVGPLGLMRPARVYVIDNEAHAYSMTLELKRVELDVEILAKDWQ